MSRNAWSVVWNLVVGVRCTIVACVVSCCAAQTATVVAGETANRPNFIVVVADDLGYGDLACYGNSRIRTPNLDRFSTQGVRLTQYYSPAPVCSPARAGLLTGRTPQRVGIHHVVAPGSPMYLPKSEITIATLLKNEAGYTTALCGKWHLNGHFNEPDHPQPGDHGFDYWFATQNNASPSHQDPDNFVRNGKPVGPLKGFSALIVADEAVSWLRNQRDQERPFFLYVCFHEPHEPIATDKQFTEQYPGAEPSLAAHHGNISQMDEAFGRIMRAVDELGLTDQTLVWFVSDNGPALSRQHPHGSAGPLRENKGQLYEGGIRVPGIIRWPGRIAAGTTSDEPVCGVDLLPTFCEIVGIKPPADRAIDGTSILPLFAGQPIQRTVPLYWQNNFARTAPKVAMREGDWKILATVDGPQLHPTDITAERIRTIKTAPLLRFELYNLHNDVGETTDLANQEPQRLQAMAAKLQAMYRQIQQETPGWPEWKDPRPIGRRARNSQPD